VLTRVLNAALMFLVGVLVGVLGTVTHSSGVVVLGVRVPWGLVVALAAVGCLLVGVRLIAGWAVGLCTALGVLVPVVVLSQQSEGGSVLIPATTIGWIWMGGAAIIALLVAAWPKLPTTRRDGPSTADA
jgi:hypothetical protein